MIADCETCERRKVPCSTCDKSQRMICYMCQGDLNDPYFELADNATESEMDNDNGDDHGHHPR